MKPEVSLQHGAEILGHVGHAGVQRRHQARVKRQQVQPERRVVSLQSELDVTAALGGSLQRKCVRPCKVSKKHDYCVKSGSSLVILSLVSLKDQVRAGPLPGDGEQGSDQLPPVGFGVHVHAEVHGSLEEFKFKLVHLLGLSSVTESKLRRYNQIQFVCRHLVY